MFDINDFDETLPGPWEWDVKRLMASFEIAGRNLGFARRRAAADRPCRGRGVPDGTQAGGGQAESRRLVRPRGGREVVRAAQDRSHREAAREGEGEPGQGQDPGQHAGVLQADGLAEPRSSPRSRRRHRTLPGFRRPLARAGVGAARHRGPPSGPAAGPRPGRAATAASTTDAGPRIRSPRQSSRARTRSRAASSSTLGTVTAVRSSIRNNPTQPSGRPRPARRAGARPCRGRPRCNPPALPRHPQVLKQVKRVTKSSDSAHAVVSCARCLTVAASHPAVCVETHRLRAGARLLTPRRGHATCVAVPAHELTSFLHGAEGIGFLLSESGTRRREETQPSARPRGGS